MMYSKMLKSAIAQRDKAYTLSIYYPSVLMFARRLDRWTKIARRAADKEGVILPNPTISPIDLVPVSEL